MTLAAPERAPGTIAGVTDATADDDLLERYRSNYGLDDGVDLSIEQVRHHLDLEQRLTAELLESSEDERWRTFERCYDELYRGLPWLTGTGGAADPSPWMATLGRPPRRIYEVGSGAGKLARMLAEAGYDVEATDVSTERGERQEDTPNLRWSVTDGVHVEDFAAHGPYDGVMSDQVLEHLHPTDLGRHLVGCRRILRPGGVYVMRTPHAFTGPHDVSRVFGLPRPVGMHLREYTNGELATALRDAGFASVAAVVPLPGPLRRGREALASPAYLRYQLGLERALAPLSPARRRRASARLPRLLRPRIFLAATAP